MRFPMITISMMGLVACSPQGTSNQVNTKAASTKEQHTADMVKSYAKKTPPSNGQSMGAMTSPKSGNTTIPITNVEVYVFTANVDDDPEPETLYWAADDTAVYVWGSIGLVCVDDSDVPTGETGTADFVMEVDDIGYGWMVGTDACGYSTLFGCSDDGTGEVCGGCDFNDTFIACVAASS